MGVFSWNGCRQCPALRGWLGVVCAGLILSGGYTGRANDLSETSDLDSSFAKETQNGGGFLESDRVDFLNWPGRIIEDSNDIFLREENFYALFLAGGISVAMHQSNADKNIAEHFERHQVFQGFTDESLNIIGYPGTHFAATGLWYALSAENGDELNRERAWTMMTALSVTWLATEGLKAVRHNDTPNGKSWAWPSVHTASSFPVSSVPD